jgi:hypothetical protein
MGGGGAAPMRLPPRGVFVLAAVATAHLWRGCEGE